MKYDLERIGKLVADIEKYLLELESYKITKITNISDTKTYHASSMVVFAILNRTIDLGNELLAVEEVGAPDTYQDIMPLLLKAGIINKAHATKLNKLIKQRNFLAHFYEDISEKDLLKTINSMPEIRQFLKNIKKIVSKTF